MIDPKTFPVVAFSGSRTFDEPLVVEKLFRRLVRRFDGGFRVRVGDAKRGLDQLVPKESLRWGKWPDVQVCHWPPHPSTRQQRWLAAHERNERVLLGGNRDDRAVILVAFYGPGPASPGTSDCLDQAHQLSIPSLVYHEGRWVMNDPNNYF